MGVVVPRDWSCGSSNVSGRGGPSARFCAATAHSPSQDLPFEEPRLTCDEAGGQSAGGDGGDHASADVRVGPLTGGDEDAADGRDEEGQGEDDRQTRVARVGG